MNVSELFATPNIPASALKRKAWNVAPAADELVPAKRAKPSPAPAPSSAARGKQRAVTIEDDREDSDDDERNASGDFAPGQDADAFADEDEDGRMYGSGLSSTQKQIIDILDADESVDADRLSLVGVRKQLLNLERAINKNRELRIKHGSDPSRFVESEVALDAALHELLLLTQNAAEFYPELVRLNVAASLIDLLNHENVDIAITVLQVLEELTDDDVGEADAEDGVQSATETTPARAGVLALVDALIEGNVLALLAHNLARLNEKDDAERAGVFQALGLLENLTGCRPDVGRLAVEQADMMRWLLDRLSKADLADQNRFYASELLAILLQGEGDGVVANRRAFGELEGVDTTLQVLSAFRKRDPRDGDETEFMENTFDALCSALAEKDVKQRFLDGEGVELMLLFMKQRKMAHSRSLKVLDHAMSLPDGAANCERFIEALGLRSLFPSFLKARIQPLIVTLTSQADSAEDEEHLLSIMASLLTSLASDSPPRLRLLAKWASDDYSKVDRLVELFEQLEDRMPKIDSSANGETDADERYFTRLEAGLWSLQMASYVLAWLCMEDDGMRDHARMLLERNGRSFADVVAILREYHANVGVDAVAVASAAEGEASITQRDVVAALIDYLAS